MDDIPGESLGALSDWTSTAKKQIFGKAGTEVAAMMAAEGTEEGSCVVAILDTATEEVRSTIRDCGEDLLEMWEKVLQHYGAGTRR